jgi:DNA-directed RNA polymerase specialized sigma24 family protein
MTMEIAVLTEKAVAGDRHAFAALIDSHKNMVYGMAVHRLGDFSHAEDLAQEVFIEAYKSLRNIKDKGKFTS